MEPGVSVSDKVFQQAEQNCMSFYRYLKDHDIHVLDCAGKVDLPVGVARLRRLSQELDVRPARHGVHRLLIDFRRTEWASEDAHRQLSRATRRDFGLNAENPSLRLPSSFTEARALSRTASAGSTTMPKR